MRCDEVIRELAAPTAERDGRAMAEHLSGCPTCAEWARRAEALDRVWEATRPVEPSTEAWDAVWARIAPTLPHPEVAGSTVRVAVPAGRRPSGRGRRILAVALIGLAQAAAILLALGLAWHNPPRPDPAILAEHSDDATPRAIRSPRPVEIQAEFEGSSLMVIHLDRDAGRIEDVTPPEMNVSSDVGMVITNEMEWIATPRVAAQ